MIKGQSQSIGVNEVDEGQYDEIKTVEYCEGSCLLVKREVLEKIGLFDTKYFAYWEEADLCTRGYKAGYKSVYVPKLKYGIRFQHQQMIQLSYIIIHAISSGSCENMQVE